MPFLTLILPISSKQKPLVRSMAGECWHLYVSTIQYWAPGICVAFYVGAGDSNPGLKDQSSHWRSHSPCCPFLLDYAILTVTQAVSALTLDAVQLYCQLFNFVYSWRNSYSMFSHSLFCSRTPGSSCPLPPSFMFFLTPWSLICPG